MRLNRFYIDKNEGSCGDQSIVVSDSALLHQIKKVLRLKVGDHVSLFHETVGEHEYQVSDIGRKTVLFTHVKPISTQDTVKSGEVRLFVSVIKKERFEWLVEKATELGVSEIIPIISERTTNKNISIDRLKKISIEATEQSGQIKPVKISNPIKLQNLNFGEIKSPAVFDFDGEDLKGIPEEVKKDFPINIFIGPEGGWGEIDKKIFQENNFKILKINSPTLRAETAAIVASYEFLK